MKSNSDQLTAEQARRINLQLPVEIRRSYARTHDNATLKNISLTGAFLSIKNTGLVNIDDKLNVKFMVSGREREVIAKVIWKGDKGCGVQFQPFNNRDVQIVDDLMYFIENKKETKKEVLNSIFHEVTSDDE